jgi:hypothetical protein
MLPPAISGAIRASAQQVSLRRQKEQGSQSSSRLLLSMRTMLNQEKSAPLISHLAHLHVG